MQTVDSQADRQTEIRLGTKPSGSKRAILTKARVSRAAARGAYLAGLRPPQAFPPLRRPREAAVAEEEEEEEGLRSGNGVGQGGGGGGPRKRKLATARQPAGRRQASSPVGAGPPETGPPRRLAARRPGSLARGAATRPTGQMDWSLQASHCDSRAPEVHRA